MQPGIAAAHRQFRLRNFWSGLGLDHPGWHLGERGGCSCPGTSRRPLSSTRQIGRSVIVPAQHSCLKSYARMTRHSPSL